MNNFNLYFTRCYLKNGYELQKQCLVAAHTTIEAREIMSREYSVDGVAIDCHLVGISIADKVGITMVL